MTEHLADFSAETLMTKAFGLTHTIHAEHRLAHGDTDAAQREVEARAQRDAIVAEMTRRSEAAERALVTVEAAERIMRLADEALHEARANSDAERIMRARALLDAGMERTTTTTCTLVKNLTWSDRIAGKARDVVLPIAQRVNEMRLR